MTGRAFRITGIALALLLMGAALTGCAAPDVSTAQANGGSPWASASPGVSRTASPSVGQAAPFPAPEDPAETAAVDLTPLNTGAEPSLTAAVSATPASGAIPSASPAFETAAARTATPAGTNAVRATAAPEPTESGGFYSETNKAGEMFGLVNQARAAAGLPDYAWDATLAPPAMKHCRDMAENDFFSHTSPTWGGFSARAAASGVRAAILGENLAYVTGYAGTASIAHELLMNSEGHRANILSEEFTRIGIAAVYDAGDDVCYFVQWFAD